MLEMENLQELALDILVAACETDEVGEDLDMDLFEAGLMDSLASVSVLIELEERTGVRLQPTDVDKDDIRTVNKFAEFLKEKIG